MIKLDISNPIHADAFLTAASNYLTEWPDGWTAQTLRDVLAEGEPDEDADDVITIWEPFENYAMIDVLELIEDTARSSLKLLKRYKVEGVE